MASALASFATLSIAVCLILASPAPGVAGDGRAGDPLRFATMNLAPYGIADDAPGAPGLFRAVNAAIVARAGLVAEDRILPLNRMLKHLQMGHFDCAITLAMPTIGAYLQPVAEIRPRFTSVLVARAGLDLPDLGSLNGRLLAIPRGSYPGHRIASDPTIRRYLTNGYDQSARLLQAGRVDAIAGSAFSVFHNLQAVGMNRSGLGSIVEFDSKPLWLHCSPMTVTAGIRERLRSATVALRRSGRIDAIFDGHRIAGFE